MDPGPPSIAGEGREPGCARLIAWFVTGGRAHLNTKQETSRTDGAGGFLPGVPLGYLGMRDQVRCEAPAL
jgi:hypothetical protein